MRKIFTILSVFFCIVASAQFPNKQYIGNPNTIVNGRAIIQIDSGYIPAVFADTLSPAIRAIPGIQIRVGNDYYMRNSTATAWLKFANTSFYSFSNLITQSPAGTVKGGGLATANTRFIMNGFRLGIDSGKVIITGNSASPSDSLLTVMGTDGSLIARFSDVDNTVYLPQINGGGGIFLQTGAATNILNGGALAFSSNGFMQSFQEKLRYIRNYPLTSDSLGLVITNDTLSAKGQDSLAYIPLSVKLTSFVDNLSRTKFSINGAGKATFSTIITSGGTTGDQTINEPSGTVNFAAAATVITVTDRLCSTNSIVYAVVRTNDATATIKNVVSGSGSFVIRLSAAATAETSVGFWIIN